MEYFVFDLKYYKRSELETEVRFDIASARSCGAVLVRYNINESDNEKLLKRRLIFLCRILNEMRRDGLIQFYVTESDFVNKGMKSEFMYNKYADYIDTKKSEKELSTFVYVKL